MWQARPKKLRTAIENLNRICEEHLKGCYHIEVVDLSKHPQLAAGEQIFALPTLVRKLPEPITEDHRGLVGRRESPGRIGYTPEKIMAV